MVRSKSSLRENVSCNKLTLQVMMRRLVKVPMARDFFFLAFSGQKLYLKLETTDLSA